MEFIVEVRVFKKLAKKPSICSALTKPEFQTAFSGTNSKENEVVFFLPPCICDMRASTFTNVTDISPSELPYSFTVWKGKIHLTLCRKCYKGLPKLQDFNSFIYNPQQLSNQHKSAIIHHPLQ